MNFCTVVQNLLLLMVQIPLTSAASHSLKYLSTGVTPGIHFPEFIAVGLVDGELFEYYDSNIRKVIPKTEWIKKINADVPDYWIKSTGIAQGNQEISRVNIATLMQRFNHTGGLHIVQWMVGCELHDNGTTKGYRQHGYDGEDFISLDLNTLTWTAANQKAVITKQKLERTTAAVLNQAYLETECIEYLKKYVEYGRSTLERKVSPEASLFQKDSSSPVVCHATGFFPKSVMISWQKNGEDLHEDVELRETLPNYTCIIQHSSLEEKVVLLVSERRVLSGGGSVGIIIGAVVAVLLLVIIVCVGVFIWKKKQPGFRHVSGNPNAPAEEESSL